MTLRNFLIFSIIAILLAGCAGSSTYNYKVSTKPYTINGTTYYPIASANGFSETGMASWYGPDFHGKKTASGEMYNKYAYTAAHKTLPFGTKVKVTNLDNGLSTTVVINDRGPFKSGRVIDLSYSAAKDISMVGTGTARVRIKAIGSTQSTSATATQTTARVATKSPVVATSGNYYVQVAAYSVRDNADKTVKQLSGMGYANALRQNNGKYVVVAGPYGTRARATTERDKLRKTYSGAFIVQ
jgi:rare lipoprotein A